MAMCSKEPRVWTLTGRIRQDLSLNGVRLDYGAS